MVVILPEDRYEDWLRADVANSRVFLEPYPAEGLSVSVPPGAGKT